MPAGIGKTKASVALWCRAVGLLDRHRLPLTTALLGLLICGSLQPFAIKHATWERYGLAALEHIGWPPSDTKDVAVNLAGYLPVGLLLCACLRHRCGRTTAVVGAVLVAAWLSFSIESVQTLIQTRYASWIDVTVNTCGALLGAALAICINMVAREGQPR